ncbi:MAG: response regulator transcription factor [Geminicoccaceae bacterium]
MSSGSSLPIEVAVADKSPLVRTALAGLLRQDRRFRLVASAGDGADLLRALVERPCDVAITGWIMPGGDGRALLAELCRAPGAPRVVIYSGDPDLTLPRRVMALGAAGFVSKREPPERLLDVVASVARGEVAFPFLDLRAPQSADPFGGLSPRQRELLEALGSGCTNAELAHQLGVSINTVKFHLRNLFDRMGVRNKAQAVHLLHESRR